MIQFDTGKAELVLLDLPKDADRFLVFNDVEPYLSYWQSVRTMRYYLPHKAYYEVIGRASDVTEDVAAELVTEPDRVTYYGIPLYNNYCHPFDWEETLRTALDSLRSILLLHNLDNPVILKRK